MSTKRNILAEIEDIRGRAAAVDDLDSGIMKLLFLTAEADRLTERAELNAYLVVACIAAIETFFRWQIRSLIDSGHDRYLSNIRLDDLPIKLNHDVAIALVGKRVTVGELVAHSVGFSSFEQVAGFMTKLLNTDFVALVESACDPASRQKLGSQAPPMLREPTKVISEVKRALELRHIVCHEAHWHSMDRSEVKNLCSSCYSFVLAAYYGIAYFVRPDAPLDLADAHRIATEKEFSLSNDLKGVVEAFAKRLTTREREAFVAMQQSWDDYAAREAVFFASVQMNGNRGEYDAVMTQIRLIAARIEEIQKWDQFVNPQKSR